MLRFYEGLVDSGRVDEANFFLATFTGYSAFLWRAKLVDSEELSEYFEGLREGILEGPNALNPYVMELLGIIAEGLTEEVFSEFLTKLRMTLREESLDRLEL